MEYVFYGLLAVAFIAFVVLVIRSYKKKLASGCCGASDESVKKNKVAPPFRKAEFDIRFGEGIDKALDILNLAVEKGVVEKAGSFFKYGGKTLAQGAEKTRDVIAEDEDLMARIEEEIMQNI